MPNARRSARHSNGEAIGLLWSFSTQALSTLDSLYMDTAIDEKPGLPKPLNISVVDINLLTLLQGVHLARHFFSEKNGTPGGRIMITASQLGLYAEPLLPLYSAAKHGLVGLVQACAPIYLKDKITINAICPTLVKSNLMPPALASVFDRPDQLTPPSTAYKAFDAVLASDKLTGQTMDLALDEVEAEHATANGKWMLDNQLLREKACYRMTPREPGQNATVIEWPHKLRI